MNLPKNTFGKSVLKTAGVSTLVSFPFAFEGGDPASSLIVGGIAGGVAAVNHIVRSVSNTNNEIRYNKRQAEQIAAREERKNRNLGRQFD